MMQLRLLFLVFLPFMVSGQPGPCTYRLQGQVTDDDRQTPLQGATVSFPSLDKTLITDEEGAFTLEGLCRGDLNVKVHLIGYRNESREIRITGNEQVHIRLHVTDLHLHEVEVTGHRDALPGTSTQHTLSQQELDQSKGENLARVITRVPGVSLLQTGTTIAKPVIHGMHSNRVLILNNGIRQEGQQWGSEHAPEIDPFIARQITVIKGAEAIRFGPEAIGGVVIVDPPLLPEEPDIHGELNLAGSSNGATGVVSGMLNGGLGKLTGLGWRVQGTLKRGGNYRTADYYLNNTGVRETNFSGALGYQHENLKTELYFSHFDTNTGIFSGSHIGDLADLIARIENGRPPDDGEFSYRIDVPRQRVIHDLLKLKGHLHLGQDLTLNLQYGLQRNRRREFDIRRGGRSGIPSVDLVLTTQTLDAYVSRLTSRGWKSTLGVNGLIQVNSTEQGTFAIPLIPNFDHYGAGIYTVQRLIKQDYELEAGLRYDYRYLDALGYRYEDGEPYFYGGTKTFHNVSASLGGVWHLNGQWDLRSNIGLAWRPPTFNELYSDGLHHATGSYEIGDSTLSSEQGYKWINTASYRTRRLDIEASAYIHWMRNYIFMNPAQGQVELIAGSFPVFQYEQTDARFWGIDLSATWGISPSFDYELKGSLVRARDTGNDRYLPWTPSDRIRTGVRWHAGSGAKLQRPWLQAQYEFVRRQTRYEVGSDYAPPPGSYHLLTLGAGAEVPLGRHKLSVNLEVSNLTNTLYKEYMNRFRYYAHDPGRNFILRMTYRF